MATYFTSDTHFGHANIIKYCSRPFESVEAMDAALIKNWNRRVGPDDTVWHLGDFSMNAGVERVRKYRERLNGRIHLIWGNHDKRTPEVAALFESVHDLTKVSFSEAGETRDVVLCHYAMRVWGASHRGAWHLYGHSHGSLTDDLHALSLDIGLDCWDYAPVSVQQIAARMQQKQWRPVDHHNGGDAPDAAINAVTARLPL